MDDLLKESGHSPERIGSLWFAQVRSSSRQRTVSGRRALAIISGLLGQVPTDGELEPRLRPLSNEAAPESCPVPARRGPNAWKPVKEHSFGVGLVLGYEFLKIIRLEFMSSSDPQTQMSVAPDRVSNRGKGDALSTGSTVGWTGQLTPPLSAGAGYRSKAWTQKLEAYRGLLLDGGSPELPAVLGLGFDCQQQEAWTIALEWQHFGYSPGLPRAICWACPTAQASGDPEHALGRPCLSMASVAALGLKLAVAAG